MKSKSVVKYVVKITTHIFHKKRPNKIIIHGRLVEVCKIPWFNRRRDRNNHTSRDANKFSFIFKQDLGFIASQTVCQNSLVLSISNCIPSMRFVYWIWFGCNSCLLHITHSYFHCRSARFHKENVLLEKHYTYSWRYDYRKYRGALNGVT